MSHTYPHNGHELPSVTTIIGEVSNKEALIQWAANSMKDYVIEHWEEMQGCGIDECLNQARFAYKRLSSEALEIGSKVHEIVEKVLTYPVIEPIYDQPEVLSCRVAFQRFIQDHEVRPEKLEYSVYGNGWAGTLDFKGLLDGVPTILDWKTSKAIWTDSMYPQIAAYWDADGQWADQGGIVRLDKVTGQYELKLIKRKELQRYLTIFNAMADLYFIRHPRIAKKAGRLL